MNNFENIVANNLLYLRKKAGLTQTEFGEKFNYSDKTVSKWELGTVVPSVETLKQIADFYGVSIDYIVTEHYSQKELDSVTKKTVNSSNKIALIALAGVFILFIAVTMYVASILNLGTADPTKNRWWCVFLWMLPVGCVAMAYLTRRFFGRSIATTVLLSIAVWTLLLSAYITFYYINNYWFLFFIGIPIQIGLILITKVNSKK